MNLEEFIKKYQKVSVEEFPNYVLDRIPEPLVSCRVSTYQHAPYIRECLEGILIQKTNFPYEIVIGEDESNDGNREICIEYAKKYPDKIRIFLHWRENNIPINGNPSSKFQSIYTMYHCRGKYQAICEGDDYWTDPYKLQKQVDFLEANTEYVICYHNSTVVDGSNKLISESRLSDASKRDYSREGLIKASKILPQTMCFRNVLRDLPDEFFRAFGGDKFLTSLLGAYGKGKYLSDIKPSAFRIHSGGVNAGEKDVRRQFSKHLSTRIALYQYYERIGEKDYADYFLLDEIHPLIKKIAEYKSMNEGGEYITMPDTIRKF